LVKYIKQLIFKIDKNVLLKWKKLNLNIPKFCMRVKYYKVFKAVLVYQVCTGVVRSPNIIF